MVLAATNRPDIADVSKAIADELRGILGPLLAFRIEGKTLTLKQVRNARGVAVESAPTFQFVRVE
jgi:hypothetical protein